MEAKAKRKMFPLGEATTPTSSNAPLLHTSHFFNKVGGFLSSSVKDLKKQNNNSTAAASKKEEPDWEVIDNVDKSEGTEDSSQFYIPLSPDKEKEPVESSDGVPDVKEKEPTTVDDNNSSGGKEQKSAPIESCYRSASVSAAGNVPTRFEREGSHFVGASISKKGYLRINERGRSKTQFPLLYFILDKQYGELLSQAQDQKSPGIIGIIGLISQLLNSPPPRIMLGCAF